MTPPPNDESIPDALSLYRRIPAVWVVPDENQGGVRISSGAFSGEEMSVVLDDTLRADGRVPEGIIEGLANVFLAAITAGFARAYEQGVIRSALPDEPAHGDVTGRKSKRIKNAFASEASSSWVVAPPSAA